MMIESILSDFSFDCRSRGFAFRTIQSYSGNVRYFLETHGIDSSYDDFRDFLIHLRDEQNYAVPTINNYFSALSSFYDYLEFEKLVDQNLVPSFRKRYLRGYKKHYTPESRQLISITDMARLVKVPRYQSYQTLILFLAKTGIRRNELITLDIQDVDLDNLTVHLKKTAKRSNRTVFFDLETKAFLDLYLSQRTDQEKALFVGRQEHRRIMRNQVYDIVTKTAKTIGLHNPKGRMDEKFGPHCARHWFTTWLRRSGMSREFIQVLRGDIRTEAIDIYDHIEEDELQEAYLKYIPQLGVKP